MNRDRVESSSSSNFIHNFLQEGLTLNTIEYFGSFLENATISKKQRTAIAGRLKRGFITEHVKETFFKRKGNSGSFVDTINTVIKVLDEENVIIPAYFRLLVLKTLVSMNRLFEEAGVSMSRAPFRRHVV